MTESIYSSKNIDYINVTKHYLYQIWNQIKQRCFNPNVSDYKNYGAIGITMHHEWINDSRAFLKWIDSNLRIETTKAFT
jgi:hypothetical protein